MGILERAAPLTMTKRPLRVGIQGRQGSGKSYTAALIAAGLYKDAGLTGRVIIFDTEDAAGFLARVFEPGQIPAVRVRSRSLADLLDVMREAGPQDIVLVDSITHPWEDVMLAQALRKVRVYNGERYPQGLTFEHFRDGDGVIDRGAAFQAAAHVRLAIHDWGPIKSLWNPFKLAVVQSPYHLIFTGRAVIQWGQQEKEDGTKESAPMGYKMKVEGETGFEPDLNIHMERVTDNDMRVSWVAEIIKDRSGILEGKRIVNPTWSDFRPLWELLAAATTEDPARIEADTGAMVTGEAETHALVTHKRKEIAVEEILTRLEERWPGTAAAAKALKRAAWAALFASAGPPYTHSREAVLFGAPQIAERAVQLARVWSEAYAAEPEPQQVSLNVAEAKKTLEEEATNER